MLNGLRKLSGLPSDGSHGSKPENSDWKNGLFINWSISGWM
ncbi:hypothetical protein O974_05860 [Mycobacterium avium 11-0986]|nr:hypothetical protein O974_05860 [Mycobacterium avium 11-0986]